VTLFEYITIAYSLVFSFAAIRLVAGLSHAMDASRRYPVHLFYVCTSLFAIASVFWAQWSSRDVEWTFPLYLIRLAGPGILYFNACTLIPDAPSSVESWQDYFFAVRKRFFGGVCIWAPIMAVNSTAVLSIPLYHPIRIVQLGVLLLGMAGLATDRPKIHRIIVLGVGVVAVLAALVILQPGPLSS
jgi:hypothetical protein